MLFAGNQIPVQEESWAVFDEKVPPSELSNTKSPRGKRFIGHNNLQFKDRREIKFWRNVCLFYEM